LSRPFLPARAFASLALAFAALAAAFTAAAAVTDTTLRYPDTPRERVIETYHGVAVPDDYRWLENAKNPAVQEWVARENALTHRVLDDLPMRESLKARFRQLYEHAPTRYRDFRDRGLFFALKTQPPKNQPMLVVMKSPGDVKSERVLLDPNALDAKGTTAIDFYVPSLDGRYVAVATSKGGSEDGPAWVIDTATGKRLPDVVPRVQYPTGGGSVEWDGDGKGFCYTRYPQGSERSPEDANFYQQVYHHRLGTKAAEDTYVIGKEFPRIAETELHASRDGHYLLASVANGDGGDFAFYLRKPDGSWTRVADFGDRIRRMGFGLDGRLYALSLKDAPRGRILALVPDDASLTNAKEIVPQGDETIDGFSATRDRLYVEYMAGGPTELRVFALDGKPAGAVPTEPVSYVAIAARLDSGDLLLETESYVSPPAVQRYSAREGKLAKTALGGKWRVSFADAQVVREMATSKDGTQVPVNILMKKGTKRDGRNPTLLYGYGGYGISMRPYFSLANRVWLDHGGLYAVANIRGGGEFGEAWHLAGNLTKKQNVFDDMIAAAEYLVKAGYTRPSRLAAMGGSNGGLLMGAILTQRPDLFRAIVSQVGIYDMLRVESTPNGAFNVTEFGSVKDPAQFEALLAYSPYHNVKDGTPYPAVLLTAGANDGRVDPYNSRKFAARLQAATSSGRPVLLRTSASTGHGIGTGLETRIDELADEYAFLMNQLGME
jgi:prolyl oligopeptidase